MSVTQTKPWTDGMKLRAQLWMEGKSTARLLGPSGESIATVHDVRGDGTYLQGRIVSTFNALAPVKDPEEAMKMVRLLSTEIARWDCTCEGPEPGDYDIIRCYRCRAKNVLELLGGK